MCVPELGRERTDGRTESGKEKGTLDVYLRLSALQMRLAAGSGSRQTVTTKRVCTCTCVRMYKMDGQGFIRDLQQYI